MARSELKKLIYPLAVMANTIIGIGIFALPYTAAKAGFLAMLAYFIALGAIVTVIHLMFGEIALKTPDYLRLPGFVKYHLGTAAEIVISACIVVSLIGVTVAFAVIGGQFLYGAVGSFFGGPVIWYSVVYLALGSALVLLGINVVEKIEFWGLVLFLLALAAIIFKALPFFRWTNLPLLPASPGDFLIPYGPVLFALWGASSIPEIEEMLGRKKGKKFLPLIIIVSSIIAILIYLIFSVSVVGFTGAYTTDSALTGFERIFGGGFLRLVFVFGLIIAFTSFVISSLTLKKILHYDLKFSKPSAWLITALLPLGLLLAGLNDFLAIVSLVGGVTLGIEGIIILLMYQKVRPDRKLITYPLILIFVAGIIYELTYYLK